LNNIGFAWYSLREYKKAIEYYNKALDIDRKTYGDSHQIVAIFLNNLGCAWYSLEEYKKSFEYFKKSLNINNKYLGTNHPSTKTVKENLKYVREKLIADGH
jgi:tetratricopeptide (TPR) repeat protein